MDSPLKEYDDSEEILGTSTTDGAVSDPSGSKKSEASPSTNKGFGLRKWRRIPRDFTRRVNNTADSVTEELSNPVLSPMTKRRSDYPEKLQKNVDDSPPPHPGSSSKGLSIAGSETASAQEQQNSSSSTASTAAKTMHFDAAPPSSAAVGISHDNKNRMPQRVKKPKGDRLKHAQRVYTSSNGNGTRSSSETSAHRENDAQVVDKKVHQDQKGGGGRREIPQEDEVSKSSSTDIRGEMNGNLGSHTHHDLLDEAISELKTAQEALGKELLMFKELGEDVEDDPTFEKSGCSIESTDTGIENFAETLIRKRIEAEVLHLVISSGTVIAGKRNDVSDETSRGRGVVWKYASVLFVQVLLLFAIVSWLVSSSHPFLSCKNVLPPT
ncbi:hypothetical protein M569_10570 [Genlisea aurea]|uniref:WPP domain-containing protein n=1 Tax=Genlisea aurea TaxID=192259 RepID=S8DW94_9LAMI|nr:hypothetical protein M569_10570 [Genlisea aurea]